MSDENLVLKLSVNDMMRKKVTEIHKALCMECFQKLRKDKF